MARRSFAAASSGAGKRPTVHGDAPSFHDLSTSELLEGIFPDDTMTCEAEYVRCHVICDLDGGPVTVRHLLLAGRARGSCSSSGVGPRACRRSGRGPAPVAATFRDACRLI